jgi:hypothetical protein
MRRFWFTENIRTIIKEVKMSKISKFIALLVLAAVVSCQPIGRFFTYQAIVD